MAGAFFLPPRALTLGVGVLRFATLRTGVDGLVLVLASSRVSSGVRTRSFLL